ncbi:MAG: CDP-glycerol glycerophosphotransferase family protein [Heyndrickxia sp.]
MIELYLFLFKIQFGLFKWLPLRKKIVFVSSFGQNSKYIYEELQRKNYPFEVVFLCQDTCYKEMKDLEATVLPFQTFNILTNLKSFYHLATAKFVVIDNYFAFLSAISFKKDVQCIQLWHAAGAIKTFGLKDRSIAQRSNRANQRFLKVYDQFHKVIVGSDAMANIFMEAFGLSRERFLCTGIPRTDLFYDDAYKKERSAGLRKENPTFSQKKVILYAPTFRDESLEHYKLMLDLDYMYRELKDEFVLLIKLHPVIHARMEHLEKYKGFVFDYTKYKDVNDLLLITDYLITDYSSIPFEYALLEKPMIFYPYDLENYESQRGLWNEYSKLVPGPVVFSTKEIVELVKENSFDMQKIKEFSKEWNKYSNGHSSENFVEYLCYQ